jgi:hypothetical protein
VAEQADAPEGDTEELNLELEGGDPPEEQEQEQPDVHDQDQDDGGAADEDEVEITFGDEAAPASRGDSSDLVKHLRAQIRELQRRPAAEAAAQVIEVGDKPTLEGCDFDGDKFEKELDSWKERKATAEHAQANAQKEADAVNARFQEQLANFNTRKGQLKVPDYEAAEAATFADLNIVQQAVIVKAAQDPAKVIYALGRHPAKRAQIAAIQDPIEQAAAIARLEGTLKVTTRKATTEPDRPVRGSGQLSVRTDKTLERLEKEAERTNDRTAVVRYKLKLKSQGRA